ncbi:MAG: histidine kinase dimerization/phospho-acceptor domain-containing protein, partial [Rhodospirillaceae bacterium]
MSDPVHPTADDDLREAMAAFAHDLRTPLTAVRMVAELARRQSHGHELHLDGELVEMFDASLDDLNALADALQETSRLRRGKLILGHGPAQLSAVVESARARIAAPLLLEGEVPGDVNGPWDIKALSRAIASLAETTNRGGGASGRVSFACSVDGACCILTLQSGQHGVQQAA